MIRYQSQKRRPPRGLIVGARGASDPLGHALVELEELVVPEAGAAPEEAVVDGPRLPVGPEGERISPIVVADDVGVV
jgi:hypothetical protein